jgi:predicted nuclease of predicted toxin-antitoxin system
VNLLIDESLQHDLARLLALTGASEPSVILLRRGGRRTTGRTHIVLTVLALAGEHLERGSLVTVEHDRLCERTPGPRVVGARSAA